MKTSLTCVRVCVASLLLLIISSHGFTQVVFTDSFDSVASAANYNQVSSGVTAVTYGFDYSSLGIPAAPNGLGTLGLKLEANMTSPGAAAAVTLHTLQSYSGRYRVRFDAWINANGPFPAGGTGSTEFLTGGVGGNGTAVNRSGATGSGGWVAVDGEGQSGIDYRVFRNAGALESATTGAYVAGTHSTSRAATDPYYSQFGGIDVANLPVQGANNGGPAQQTGTTIAGGFGFEWHNFVLEVDPTGGTGGASLLTWSIDGLSVGRLDAGVGAAFPTDGSVTLGYMDPFTSVSDNSMLSFGLIDNLAIAIIPEPSTATLALLGLAALALRRRN